MTIEFDKSFEKSLDKIKILQYTQMHILQYGFVNTT